MQNNYGTYGEVQETRDKVHECLGMNIDFSDAGKLKIGMVDYIRNMVGECTRTNH